MTSIILNLFQGTETNVSGLLVELPLSCGRMCMLLLLDEVVHYIQLVDGGVELSCLTDFLFAASLFDRWLLTSLCMRVDSYICPFSSLHFCLMYFDLCC